MIKTQDLTKAYGELRAINNLTLELEECDLFGYIGPNGSGKTTTALLLAPGWIAAGTAQPPRLILQITVDALRGDLPGRYAHLYGDGGFRYLMDEGVHYTNAHYQHANTETIVGHVSLATGTVPAAHGMVGNVWLDRETGQLTYNIEDPDHRLLTAGADVDSKTEILEMIGVFKEHGYYKGAAYLENLCRRIFTNVELWLRTGVIAPKTTSLLERIFREIGRRIKRIAWGWSDRVVTKLSKMIMIRQYSRDKWEQYWKDKLGIKGYFKIHIQSVQIAKCHNF